MEEKIFSQDYALTFDDVLILPGESNVLPTDVDISSKLTKNISLKIPIVSAAMDTVTEANMAIAMAQNSGIGIIHRNMSIEKQVQEVIKVKRFENAIIEKPITITTNSTISNAIEIMEKNGISGLLVVENGKLVGILTKRDIRVSTNVSESIKKFMTTKEKLIVSENHNISIEEAKKIMLDRRIEKLPIVDKDFRPSGLITMKDILKIEQNPYSTKDKRGRLRVGVAIGTTDSDKEHVDELAKAEVDVIVIDTAHGHSQKVKEIVKYIKSKYNVDVIAGNIATYDGAKFLIDSGADGIKVGIGPGSICTTRIVTGIGVPQIFAIMEAAKIAKKEKIPLIADGGIKYSGDIAKAIVAGAGTVMLGSLLAGTEESPGELIIYRGRSYKAYRGMGSLGAMLAGSTRYPQKEKGKFVPEGIEGMVPFKGKVKDVLFQLTGGLRASMGYVGARNIEELYEKGKFIKITNAGLKESHPHDVIITKESPNYTGTFIEPNED